jgi:hypothetical protein
LNAMQKVFSDLMHNQQGHTRTNASDCAVQGSTGRKKERKKERKATAVRSPIGVRLRSV